MSKSGNERGKRNKLKAKEDARKQDSRTGALSGRGPVGLFVAKLIDMVIFAIKKTVSFFWHGLTKPTFQFVYDFLFSEFRGVFAGKEKDGDCYNSSIFRYMITILVPPVGIFLSKGMYGWPSIVISVILTFYHIFPGIIYAIVVTYNSRYADRYQLRELQRIEKRRREKGERPDKYSFTALVISLAFLVGVIYLLITFAKKVGDYSKSK
jgi:uncharacterized membrane protein YqaE (UPF0057 family)